MNDSHLTTKQNTVKKLYLKKIAIILILLLTMGSCIKQSLLGHNAQVFKFKEGHYRPDNAYVILTRDKTGISAIPVKFDSTVFPAPLVKGYYVHRAMYCGMAYLSISKQEYNEIVDDATLDTLFKLVIDPDPFSEFYSAVENTNLYVFNHYDHRDRCIDGIDTVYINELIRDGALETEFERVK